MRKHYLNGIVYGIYLILIEYFDGKLHESSIGNIDVYFKASNAMSIATRRETILEVVKKASTE